MDGLESHEFIFDNHHVTGRDTLKFQMRLTESMDCLIKMALPVNLTKSHCLQHIFLRLWSFTWKNFQPICNVLLDRFVLNEPFIDNTGPSLGSLTVYTKNAKSVMTPVWRLYNHQGPEWRYAQALIPETTEHMVRFIVNPTLTKRQTSTNEWHY
jgi:hypothetical protein